jgi:major membrane immunogen (membrane-anchored lipoprotein)
MIPDGTYTAVLDRFEDSDPVLELSGDDGRYELVVEQQDLPQPARHTDAVLEVELVDGAIVAADYKPAESERRVDDAQNRFDRLSKRPPDDETP